VGVVLVELQLNVSLNPRKSHAETPLIIHLPSRSC
jgi:hypothetical protein